MTMRTYLLSSGLLGCKLDLARQALREAEDALVGTVSDGTVELRSLETVHLEFIRLLDELQQWSTG